MKWLLILIFWVFFRCDRKVNLVSFLFYINQQRNFLLTVGEDEQISPQLSSVCLKVFDLDKTQPEGPSTSIPDCIQILRIFTNQFPEAKVPILNFHYFVDVTVNVFNTYSSADNIIFSFRRSSTDITNSYRTRQWLHLLHSRGYCTRTHQTVHAPSGEPSR